MGLFAAPTAAVAAQGDSRSSYTLRMKTTLYMAISTDGFIAGEHDETPWSDDSWQAFKAFITSCDIVLLGRRTYQIMTAQDEFVDGPEYVVVTHDPSFDTGSLRKLSIASRNDMPKAEKVGIIGGGELNGRLAELGVIDEIILDVEPTVLGSGKRLFGDHKIELNLELMDSRRIGGSTIQNRYKVKS